MPRANAGGLDTEIDGRVHFEPDARRMRGERPFIFTNLKIGKGVAEIAGFIRKAGGVG